MATDAELPDAKLLVDSDADFLLCGYTCWLPNPFPSLLYRISDASNHYLQSADVDIGNDWTTIIAGASTPEMGTGSLVKVINPYRRIPAGSAIEIRLIEWSGVNPNSSWVKIAFHGLKEYVL